METESSQEHARGPFRLDRCGDLTPLGRVLEDAGFDEPSVAETVQQDDSGRPIDVPACIAVMRKLLQSGFFTTEPLPRTSLELRSDH